MTVRHGASGCRHSGQTAWVLVPPQSCLVSLAKVSSCAHFLTYKMEIEES